MRKEIGKSILLGSAFLVTTGLAGVFENKTVSLFHASPSLQRAGVMESPHWSVDFLYSAQALYPKIDADYPDHYLLKGSVRIPILHHNGRIEQVDCEFPGVKMTGIPVHEYLGKIPLEARRDLPYIAFPPIGSCSNLVESESGAAGKSYVEVRAKGGYTYASNLGNPNTHNYYADFVFVLVRKKADGSLSHLELGRCLSVFLGSAERIRFDLGY